LADALQRAANAEAEMERLKTPRSISRSTDLIATLKPFKGTKYVFVSVFQDEEAINFLREIHEILRQAGWERDKSVAGFPALNVYGKDQPDFSVPVGFNTGIQISVESPVPLETLQSTSMAALQPYIRGAAALKFGIDNSTEPVMKNAGGQIVNVETGSSITVRIAVGKKPAE
jgi:hypothetical protein